jgi:hypothetical protein
MAARSQHILDCSHPPSSPAALRPIAVNAFAQSPALEIFTASRKEAAERREKFFIQSDLRLGLAAGFGGFGVIADEHARSGSSQRRRRR